MTFLRSTLAKGALIAAVASGTLAAASTASADVVCNRFGECWHTYGYDHDYPTGVGIVIHSNDWGWRHRHDHDWRRDHYARGYYDRDGFWISF